MARGFVKKTFYDEQGRLAVFAFPNLPLIIWAVATLASHFFWHGLFSFIALAALVIWALLEIFQGVNYFRRALGAVVLAITLWSRLH
jgi:thiosulfate reductase cytochrome b subunit